VQTVILVPVDSLVVRTGHRF